MHIYDRIEEVNFVWNILFPWVAKQGSSFCFRGRKTKIGGGKILMEVDSQTASCGTDNKENKAGAVLTRCWARIVGVLEQPFCILWICAEFSLANKKFDGW